jgi:hypothetical protein
MARIRLRHLGAKEHLRDVLIDAYLLTLVDVHVG